MEEFIILFSSFLCMYKNAEWNSLFPCQVTLTKILIHFLLLNLPFTFRTLIYQESTLVLVQGKGTTLSFSIQKTTCLSMIYQNPFFPCCPAICTTLSGPYIFMGLLLSSLFWSIAFMCVFLLQASILLLQLIISLLSDRGNLLLYELGYWFGCFNRDQKNSSSGNMKN